MSPVPILWSKGGFYGSGGLLDDASPLYKVMPIGMALTLCVCCLVTRQNGETQWFVEVSGSIRHCSFKARDVL